MCRFWEWSKSSIFKKLGKHWLGFPHLKQECGAFLNARELTREKKVDMGENLSPHEGREMSPTVSISGWVLFFFNAIRTGLYFPKAVGVIPKNTEF